MADITFEKFALGLESTRGTPVDPPTHYANMAGTLGFGHEYYSPDESRGELEESYRDERVREFGEFEAEGGLDPDLVPVFLEMLVKGGVSPTQPDATNAPNTYLWRYKQSLSTDDIKTSTIYFGDEGVQILQGAFGFLEDFSVEADASGTEGPSLSVSGLTTFPVKQAPGSFPTQTVGKLLTSVHMQAWIDRVDGGTPDITSIDDAGVNQLTGRVVSMSFEAPSGIIPKYLGKDPGTDLSYSKIGRDKRRVNLGIQVEFPDTVELDRYLTNEMVRLRVRLNGRKIEDDGMGTDYYAYVQFDAIGRLKFDDWGELEGVNRTIEFMVESTKFFDAEPSWAIEAQNEVASL